MIGRIGGGRNVEPSANEAFGCFFFILMPIVALLTGQGWIGAVLYMIIGIAIPTVHYWWKKREERIWRENELWSIFNKLEKGRYTKLSFKRNLYAQDVDGDYRISAIQFDSKTVELAITLIDYRNFEMETVIKLDGLNYVRTCDIEEIPKELIGTKVIYISGVRSSPFFFTGYFIFRW